MKSIYVNLDMMDQPMEHYHLYCMNKQCPESVYDRKTALQIPFFAKCWIGTYRCNCCNKPLVPDSHAATGQATAEAGYQNTNNTYLFNR